MLSVMSTVAEIEKALESLVYLDAKCNAQIDADIAAGKLDALADEARAPYKAGRGKLFNEIAGHS